METKEVSPSCLGNNRAAVNFLYLRARQKKKTNYMLNRYNTISNGTRLLPAYTANVLTKLPNTTNAILFALYMRNGTAKQ